jgi:hypothetical protein
LERAEGRVEPVYAGVWISGEWRAVRWCCSVLYNAAPGRECGEQLHTATSYPVLSVLGERGRGALRSRMSVKIDL